MSAGDFLGGYVQYSTSQHPLMSFPGCRHPYSSGDHFSFRLGCYARACVSHRCTVLPLSQTVLLRPGLGQNRRPARGPGWDTVRVLWLHSAQEISA